MVLMQRDLDSIGAQTLGLDPMIVLGLSTMGFAAAGWLLGPFFGNAVFNLVHRGVRGQIDAVSRGFLFCSFWVLGGVRGRYDVWKVGGWWCLRVLYLFFGGFLANVHGLDLQKERAFYARIKKYRVDPTSSSMANPVPDYYGEKIGSVADYRRWLKDQRAFNLKRGRTI